MNIRKALNAPREIITATENATTIAILALIVAAVALIAATHRKAAG